MPNPGHSPKKNLGTSAPNDDESRIFKAIADNAFFGNVFIDSEGIFRYVNGCFASMHGYRPEELVGQHISIVHTPEQLEVSKRIIEASIASGSSEPQEHWYLHRDGTVFPLLVGCVSVTAEGGDGTYTALSAVDLSPLRRAEIAYQTLFDEMLDGFARHQIICDDSGAPVDYRFLAVNPAYEKMTGLKAKEIIGRTVREVLPGVEQYWIDRFGKVATTGKPNRFEDYTAPLDKYFEVTAYCPAPGEFACIVQDITETKHAQESVQRSEYQLRRTQRLAHVGSWTWDFATEEVTWTDMLFEVFGLEPGHAAPTFSEQEALVTPETYKALSEAVAKTRDTGVPYEVELEIPRDDGTSRWLWARGEPIMGPEGRMVGLWGAAQDITDRKGQEAEKLHLEAQLARAQRLESIGRLAGGVAHDFNNMLTIILGRAEQNLAVLRREEPLYTDLEEIRQVAERSANLTRQLLAFARNQPVLPRVIDVNETIEAILTMLRRLLGEDITLTWKPSPAVSPIRIDPTQVDQILVNLCVNARDAIDTGGSIIIETANVTLDEHHCAQHPGHLPGDYVELAVTDTGSGMDSYTQAHLFEPFFTTKDPGEGTGLGLSSLYGMVTQNQGFISVHSEPDIGTTFRIYFPQVAGTPESVPDLVVDENAPRSATILLVEDDPLILKMTATMLLSRGYTVLTATTPKEAIRIAEDRSGVIDLLLSDVIMPGMNGIALAEQLRSSRPHLKCLFMSGYTANIVASNGLLKDTTPFIAKPFHLTDLSAKVKEVLEA